MNGCGQGAAALGALVAVIAAWFAGRRGAQEKQAPVPPHLVPDPVRPDPMKERHEQIDSDSDADVLARGRDRFDRPR